MRSAPAPTELLLDNMDPPTMRAAVELRDELHHPRQRRPSRPPAGVNLETVRAVAETGVDFISVGALTHSAPVLDFSLLLDTP